MAELAYYYFTNDSDYEVSAFTADAGYVEEDHLFGLPMVKYHELENSFPPSEYDIFIALSYSKLNDLRKNRYLDAKERGYTLASYISSKATILNDGAIGDNCFILEDNTNFSKENFDDVSWKTLNVPHDWSFEKGVRKGGDQGQGGGYHDGGIGWYRKYFDIKKESLSKITYINFDGVYMNSEVWINGNYLGKRPYGYISFRYDISKYLKEGKNTIAVRVDNALEPSARWYHPCGIYAPVKLIEVNKTHIQPNSIFIKTPSIDKNKATVSIDALINGDFKRRMQRN